MIIQDDMPLDELLKLQKAINENLVKHKDKVIQDIIGKMNDMNITLTDLQEHLTPIVETKKRKPKYQLDGNLWTGNGKKPLWVVNHLANGGTLDDILIPSN